VCHNAQLFKKIQLVRNYLQDNFPLFQAGDLELIALLETVIGQERQGQRRPFSEDFTLSLFSFKSGAYASIF